VNSLQVAADLVQHDDVVLDEAFRRYYAPLVRRLAIIVGDAEEARDLAQEAFARAFERGPTGTTVDAARWLTRVGVRLAIDERRRRGRWRFRAVEEADAAWAMNTDPDLWLALKGLEPRVRAALVLHTLEGYTQDEIADALGVTRGTVASWLSRARARLRPLIEEA
jgi:RNA polymerase sigma-70 factor (ECF subfamily)